MRELRSLDRSGVEHLLYLKQRACVCDLWLINCPPEVAYELNAFKRRFHLVNVLRVDPAPSPAETIPWHTGRRLTSSGHKSGA